MARSILRRKPRAVELEVTGVEEETERPGPLVWWPLAAAGGGLIAPLATALVVLGLVVLGWTATPDIDLQAVLTAAGRLWLLSWFSGGTFAGVHVTIAPLGLTALNAVIASGIAGFAATMARRAAPEELDQHQRRRLALKSAGLFTTVQSLCVLVVAFLVGEGGEPARALIGAVVVGGGAALIGAARACEWHPLIDLPLWARAIPRAVSVGVLTVVATGAGVLAVQLYRQRSVVAGLHDALQAGGVGGALLVVLQLLWLPNVTLWCAAWALGAGISVGQGTMVTPSANEVGMLPGVPLFGAVPGPGPGPASSLWWLLSGVLAGVLSAVVLLRARRRARFDETALVGGLAGVLTGGALTLLAAASRGDLGELRLVALGPRLLQLGVMSTTLMGLAGLLTGLVVGVLRRPVVELSMDDTSDGELSFGSSPASADRVTE